MRFSKSVATFLPVSGRVPREGRACLWHTILLARSSVLYLLFRWAGKEVLSAVRTAALFPTENGRQNREGTSRFACRFHQGSRCGMQWSTGFRRNKRYIKNSNKLSFFIFDAVFLAPCGATEKHGDVSIVIICRWKQPPSPASRRGDVSLRNAFKMIVRFRFFARCAFKMKADFVRAVCPIRPNE